MDQIARSLAGGVSRWEAFKGVAVAFGLAAAPEEWHCCKDSRGGENCCLPGTECCESEEILTVCAEDCCLI